MKKQGKKPKPPSNKSLVEQILDKGDRSEVRALFAFDRTNTKEEVLLKFSLWARWFFPQYFKAQDAPFHRDIDTFNFRIYRGLLKSFVNIVFRGGAKTT